MDESYFIEQRNDILNALKEDPKNEELKKVLKEIDDLLNMFHSTKENEEKKEEKEEEEDMFADPQPKKQKLEQDAKEISTKNRDISIKESNVQVQNCDYYSPIDKFEDLGKDLDETIVSNLKNNGFNKPTPIQRHSIPILFHLRRDVLACAQTGSGKTIAFLLPIIAALVHDTFKGKIKRPMSYHKKFPLALVLAPTRELVIQIQEEAEKLTYGTPFQSIALYGGINKQQQKIDLVSNSADIVIATPGRLVDLMEQQKIGLSSLSFFVLDEADRMLDMGFERDIKKITNSEGFPQKTEDKRKEMQTVLFSATFPKEIRRLAEEFLDNYVFVRIGLTGGSVVTIKQTFHYLEENEKESAIVKELEGDNNGLILVFVETKKSAEDLSWFLHEKNIKCTAIHGNLTQKEREEALASFKSEKTPILVATNVADFYVKFFTKARGLDVENVAKVINYDLPTNIQDYIHRIGRTGRAGKEGLATSFFSKKNQSLAKHLVKQLQKSGQEVPPWMMAMNE